MHKQIFSNLSPSSCSLSAFWSQLQYELVVSSFLEEKFQSSCLALKIIKFKFWTKLIAKETTEISILFSSYFPTDCQNWNKSLWLSTEYLRNSVIRIIQQVRKSDTERKLKFSTYFCNLFQSSCFLWACWCHLQREWVVSSFLEAKLQSSCLALPYDRNCCRLCYIVLCVLNWPGCC